MVSSQPNHSKSFIPKPKHSTFSHYVHHWMTIQLPSRVTSHHVSCHLISPRCGPIAELSRGSNALQCNALHRIALHPTHRRSVANLVLCSVVLQPKSIITALPFLCRWVPSDRPTSSPHNQVQGENESISHPDRSIRFTAMILCKTRAQRVF